MPAISRLRTDTGELNQIGARVRERIDALELSNSLVCGRIAHLTNGRWNPTRVDITNIIHGRRAVTTVELAVLARALETSAAWLMGEKD